jgi:hypothetical protein
MTMLARPDLHRVLLALILIGNTIAFAGVDPVSRLLTAAIVLVAMLDMRKLTRLPRLYRHAGAALALLVTAQLLPLPFALRKLLQPGFAEMMHPGWAPLSLAPWSTLQAASSLIVLLGIALMAARMAATRSGLPMLLTLLAVTGATTAVLGLASEPGIPEKVMMLRLNTGGGQTYGPYVNHNHFALGIELTLPALVVLLAVSGRHLAMVGAARRRASVIILATALGTILCCAVMLRCGSRGGVVALLAAWLVTWPLWLKPHKAKRWLWVAVATVTLAGAVTLAWTQLPDLKERFDKMLAVEGLESNDRWDLWAGTFRLWQRNPLLGSGLGTYHHVIGPDKPPTQGKILEHAHNDWLEWLATTGVVGGVILVVAVLALAWPLRPASLRRLRFELRYPLAGASLALVATALHETIGFGLQTPANRYLVAAWLGLIWGLTAKIEARRQKVQDKPNE